jgi:hypothetical protein
MSIIRAVVSLKKIKVCLALRFQGCCALLFCLSHVLLGSVCPSYDYTASASGLHGSPVSAEHGSLACGNQGLATDAIVQRLSECDPFLGLLSLRAASADTSLSTRMSTLSVLSIRPAGAPAPDISTSHLRFLARSAQLLC